MVKSSFYGPGSPWLFRTLLERVVFPAFGRRVASSAQRTSLKQRLEIAMQTAK